MRTPQTILHAAAAAALLAASSARAAPPQVMTYSGYLKAAGGAPVTAATNLTFRLYTAAAGGSPVWSEMVSVTPGGDGWFSAVIGTTSPLPFDVLGQDLYLSLQVDADAELAQRARVTPSPSALTVDWSGVQGKPTCATGDFLTLDSAGALLCTPPGPGAAVTSVSGAPGGFVTASTAAGAVSLGLTGCAGAGQMLQWNGTSWQCVAAPASGFTPPACASAGSVLKWDGAAWQCAADASGLAAVAVSAPLTGDGTAGAPVSLGVASASSSGYVTAADFVTFGGKAPSPGAACLPSEVLTWTGVAFSCVADQNSGGTVTGVGAGAGLTGGGTSGALTLAADLTPSGGANGTATQVARGDHTHPLETTIPLSDFAPLIGTATLARVTLATYVQLPAWTIGAAGDCILGSTRIPPGMGGATGVPPVIEVLAASPTTAASYIALGVSGLVVGTPPPTGQWAAPGNVATSFTANTLVKVSNAGNTWGSFQVTGSTPPVYAVEGDTFLVRVCGGVAGTHIFRVSLIWN